jgi:hypothetical protein
MTKSSNHMLSFHRLASNSSSATNLPWLSQSQSQSQSQSYIATDSHSVSKSCCRAPCGAYNQTIICCLTVTVLFLWGALSDERTGLSFVYTAGSCQRSLSRDHILHSQIWDFLFIASYDSQGHRGSIRHRLHTGITALVKSKYVAISYRQLSYTVAARAT